ncbi:MAG: GNAT family N-acetyltransferase, partial [bacterium]|nr:GNAT family N-acetyltransferase [bacterium]
KLAVNLKYQKNGFGKYLLFDVLVKAKVIIETAGCHAIIVDAIDAKAFAFYEKFGFISFTSSRPLSLFLPISTIPDIDRT